jgi:hypothetical protein
MHSSRTVKQQQQQAGADGLALANGHSTEPQGGQQTLGFANESQYLLVNQASVDYVGGKLSTTSSASAASAAAAAAPTGEETKHAKHQAAPSSSTAVDALRFRPNVVVSGFEPWAEDAWSSVVFTPAPKSATAWSSALPAPASEGPRPQAAACTQQQQQHQPAASISSSSSSSSINQQQQSVRAAVSLQVVGPCGRCDMVSIDQHTGQRRGSQLLALLARERRVGGKLQFGVLLANGGEVQQGQVLNAPVAGAQWLHVGDVVTAVAGGKD